MSPSAYITVRTTKSGKRYVVRFRVGGRYSKLRHAGSFKTQKAARDRRDFVIGELAAGRDPLVTLRQLEHAQKPALTLRQHAERYVASRVDVKAATVESIEAHLLRVTQTLGDRDPFTLTPEDVTGWIAAQDLAPSSLARYFATFRLLLDEIGVEPNPCRDRSVKLPRVAPAEVPSPPSASQVAAILSAVPTMMRLPIRVLEQTGMRIGEVEALEWRDVDLAGSRFRVREGKTAAARRWVQVPVAVMDELADTAPDNRDGRVFGVAGDALRRSMIRACKAMGIPRFTPHDLRHRYASVKIKEGVPATELAAQLGHTKKALTLDTYSHVLLAEGDE